MICKHCNKRIWFWQGKSAPVFEPINGSYHAYVRGGVVKGNYVYYHIECKAVYDTMVQSYDDARISEDRKLFLFGEPSIEQDENSRSVFKRRSRPDY